MLFLFKILFFLKFVNFVCVSIQAYTVYVGALVHTCACRGQRLTSVCLHSLLYLTSYNFTIFFETVLLIYLALAILGRWCGK